MSDTIQLNGLQPLAKGHSRLVFQHPFKADCLIKVVRPDIAESRFGTGTKWYKRRRRYGQYISYVREIQEYVAGWACHGNAPPFAQTVIGFERTDLGLGLVVRAVRGRDGGLAPDLTSLVASGRFDAAARKDLDHFISELFASDIIVSDLNTRNLVHAVDETDGTTRFVLIDGLGNNNIVPFKTMARWINRRSKEGRVRRLHRKIERLLEAAPLNSADSRSF